MNTSIILKPEEVWKYYVSNMQELQKQMKLIAYNADFDTEIQICEEGDLLTAYAYLDNHEVYAVEMLNERDTKSTIEKMYEKYIYDAENFVTEMQLLGEAQDEEEMIEEREAELDDAAYDFLIAVLGEAFDTHSKETQEILEDLKDCICPMLYEKHGIDVYRPMYIADEKGNEEFCLYPYSEITEEQAG